MRKSIILLLCVHAQLMVASFCQAEGQLMVMPATTKIFNSHEQKITVKNIGDAPLYLSIKLLKVENPGLTPEIRKDIVNLDHPELLATPEKITLGSNQSRTIILKSLKEPVVESLYRLYITPVRKVSITNAPVDKITAPLQLSIGYGVLVRHMPAPADQQSGWDYKCDINGIILSATGNIRKILARISSDSAEEGKTAPAVKLALFPGSPQHFVTQHMVVKEDEVIHRLQCPK